MEPYREDEINSIHEHEHCITSAHLPVAVGEEQQADRDNVVCEHLPVVFAALFDMNDKKLLHPKCGLRKVVELERGTKHQAWVVAPE